MKLLFITPMFDDETYKNILRKTQKVSPGQKFYRLMYEGLLANGLEIIPISFSLNDYREEIVSNSKIRYCFGTGKKSTFSKFKLIYNLVKLISRNVDKDTKVICDAESIFGLIASIIVKKIKKIKVITVVTDFPNNVYSYSASHKKHNKVIRNLKTKINEIKLHFYRKADAFILLTSYMSDVVAKKNQPWIVTEGFSDSKLLSKEEEVIPRKGKNIVYAGALNGKSGIMTLIGAIKRIHNSNISLQIYGSGNLVDNVIEEGKKDSRITYNGVTTLDEIVNIEKRAFLLINPRPAKEEFNKYSFPSKTMEYMSSGRPVVTTRLAGIPEEYDRYLFYVDEDEKNMAIQLEKIIQLDEQKLNQKGMNAKKFVLYRKNNIAQAERIKEFIRIL
ncbi:glycosyltransferase [Sutcliffiella horikoshii]|uniref:glycosyltransferase n=1 Tax=Sutcliffiella horikoshii TaxID=79883 RepID=UPI003CEEDADD